MEEMIVNNKLHSWVHCIRGLWQGNHLYSYLFILLIDAFYQVLLKDKDARSSSILLQLHFLYFTITNDTLLFSRAKHSVVENLHILVVAFTFFSGLKINMSKFFIYIGREMNIDDNLAESLYVYCNTFL